MNYEYMKYFDELSQSEKTAINKIVENLWRKERWCKQLREDLQEAKDKAYKDKELQEMKKKYLEMKDDYYRGFPISEKEEEAINNWISNHEKEKHSGKLRLGAIGGNYSYHFLPTSIGTSGVIVCGSCGEEFEFQEL